MTRMSTSCVREGVCVAALCFLEWKDPLRREQQCIGRGKTCLFVQIVLVPIFMVLYCSDFGCNCVCGICRGCQCGCHILDNVSTKVLRSMLKKRGSKPGLSRNQTFILIASHEERDSIIAEAKRAAMVERIHAQMKKRKKRANKKKMECANDL